MEVLIHSVTSGYFVSKAFIFKLLVLKLATGVEGIEPPHPVLETSILPLN